MSAARIAGVAILAVALVVTGSGIGLALAGECSKDQKRALEKFLEGRVATAKIGLPLRSFPGLWVYWNGEYNLEYYAESLKRGPVSIPPGRAGVIKKVGFSKDEVYVDVNGRGASGAAFNRAGADPEWAFRKGSRVRVTYGRKLTEQDCRIESVVLALSGIIDVAGAEPYRERGARAAGLLPAEPGPDDAAGVTAGAAAPDAAVDATPAASPSIRILAAEVEPVRLQPGDEVKLVVHFQLSGLASGAVAPVAEARQLYLQDAPLFSSPRVATRSWHNGTHTTDLTMRFPGSASAGVYRFVVTLEALGQTLEREAAFVVGGR